MRFLFSTFILPKTEISDKNVYLCKVEIDVTTTLLGNWETIPRTDNTNYKGRYQQVLFIMFTLMGAYADVEVHTPGTCRCNYDIHEAFVPV